MSTFAEDEMDFEKDWSACAGERSAYGECVAFLRQEAAHAFVDDRPEAHEIKRLAKHIQKWEEAASEKLKGFIAESQRRKKAGAK